MLVSLIDIEINLINSQVIIYLLFNSQVHRYVSRIEEDGGILGVSIEQELFNLITDISDTKKAAQSLIQVVLNLYYDHDINLPLVLGEIKTPDIDFLKPDS